MSSRAATSRILSRSEVRSHCEDASQPVRKARGEQLEADLSDLAAQRRKRVDAEHAFCSARFAAAVNALGKHAAYAEKIGVSEGVFSEILAGKRAVQLRYTLPLYEHDEAKRVWLNWQCEKADLAPVRPKRRAKRRQIAEAVLSMVEAMGTWPLYRERAAAMVGVSPEAADLALSNREDDEQLVEVAS